MSLVQARFANITDKKTLLIASGNQQNMQTLTEILHDTYKLMTAKDGREALDILNSTDDNQISALVIDLVMPVMNGYELIKKIRSDGRICQLPIVVASSECDNDQEEYALSLGASDYVSNPYKPEIIKRRIANVICLRESSSFITTVQNDSLTGIYSKEYFFLCADELLKRNPYKKYDIICCDIEGFKLINDLYGVRTGDEILKSCAKIIKDIVGTCGMYGRIGSDVFAVLVEHNREYREKYFEAANERFNKINSNINIIMRFGICESNGDRDSVMLLCDRARFALSCIKGHYGTYYKIYDGETREKKIDEQYIISNMKKALNENQFVVYFQPKFDLKTQKAVGAEALVRWNSPEKGLLSPSEFIPIFEKNGFITELDIFVWDYCCKKIRNWIDSGNIALPVSVNVSRADIYNPNIDKILLSLMDKYKLNPNYIYLEITESAYTENPVQLVEVVKRLKKSGFLIEMDDFGSGYSSLNMLSELPIDIIKLDMGFLQNHESESNRNILSFIISLAKWLHLGTIAEGAETSEHVALLRSLNCDCAQGFYFSIPMIADDFEELISKQSGYIPAPGLTTSFNHSEMERYHAETIVYIGKDKIKGKYFRDVFSSHYMVTHCTDSNQFYDDEMGVTADVVAILYEVESLKSVKDFSKLAKRCEMMNIPIVSIHTNEMYIEEIIKSGAADYILKPFFEEPIRQRVENLIFRKHILKTERDSELETAIQEMKNRAEHDPLTGLLNRAEFKKRVTELISVNEKLIGFFMMIDIDNFKLINDTYGHSIGDSVLESIGKTIHKLFRENDVMGRMGGDEFAIFIPASINQKDLIIRIEKMCEMLKFSVDSVPVYCSVGISVFPRDGKDFQTLYENADIALLYAKRNGKNQYKLYENGMSFDVDKKLEIRAETLLDNVSDAMFVCDAVTSQIVYINDTACNLVGKSKRACMGARCYQLFWDRCKNCVRCNSINDCNECFYEETTYLKDGKTKVHIKAKMDKWNDREVKVHYLKILN